MPGFLTPRQFARATGWGHSTIKKFLRGGKIEGAILEEDAGSATGQRWRVPAELVDSWRKGAQCSSDS